MSAVWGLYPGSHMTPRQSRVYADAAHKLIDRRMRAGSGSTGCKQHQVFLAIPFSTNTPSVLTLFL